MAKKQPKPSPRQTNPAPTPAASAHGGIPFQRKIALALGLIAALVYLNTLGHAYVLDDPLAISANEVVKRGFAAWPELLTTHYRQGTEGASASALLYRPLSLMAFAAEWAIAPNSPGFGHFMNVLFYALSVMMIFLGMRRLAKGYHWSWAAGTALLFAVHPIHTEVVANIKSRDEIFVVLFSMLSFYGFARFRDEKEGSKWLIISLIAYFLALLSKESAVMLWPVFVLAGWFFGQQNFQQSIVRAVPYLGPLLLFFVMRTIAFTGVKDGSVIDVMDNPIVAANGFGERAATGFAVIWQYIQLLVVPHPLLSDYSYEHFPLAKWSDLKTWLGVLSFVGLLGLGIWGWQRRHPLAFCILAFGCGMLLYTQLITVIGTLFGERLAFGPSVWFCAAVVWLLGAAVGAGNFNVEKNEDSSWPPYVRTLGMVLGGISLVFAGLTWMRNGAWRDNMTLFETDSAKAPRSVRLHNGVSGEVYNAYLALPKEQREGVKASMMQRVIKEAQAANAIKPNLNSYINLGNAATVFNQLDSAIIHYKKALELAPKSGIALRNLSQTLLAQGRREGRERNNLPGAAKLFEESIALGNATAEHYIDLGTVYGMMGRNADAIGPLERATQMDPKNKDAWRNLSAAYNAVGNTAKAAEAAGRAR
jgi:protein O-mannosyl-transferase